MSRNILLADDPEITGMFKDSIEFRASKLGKKVDIVTVNNSVLARLTIEKGKVDVLITGSITETDGRTRYDEMGFNIVKSLKEVNPNSYVIGTSNSDRAKDWEGISDEFAKKVELHGRIMNGELDRILFGE